MWKRVCLKCIRNSHAAVLLRMNFKQNFKFSRVLKFEDLFRCILWIMFFQIWRGYWIWKLLNSMNYHKILYIVFCVSLTIFIRLEKWNSFSQNEATKYRCRTPHCYSLWREIFFYYSGKIQYLGLKKRVFARKYARWIIFEILNPLWILKYCLIHFGFWNTVWSTWDFEILFDPIWADVVISELDACGQMIIDCIARQCF